VPTIRRVVSRVSRGVVSPQWSNNCVSGSLLLHHQHSAPDPFPPRTDKSRPDSWSRTDSIIGHLPATCCKAARNCRVDACGCTSPSRMA
jgi:hypothetical protein